MSYDEDEIVGGKSFSVEGGDEEEPLEPLEDGALNDFRFDEDAEEDPEDRYH